MPRALFISTAVPPLAESQTIRNVFLLRGLHAAGFEIVVISGPITGSDPRLTGLLPPMEIHRTGPAPFDTFNSRLERLPGGRRLQWLAGIWANFFAIPDQKFGWESRVWECFRAIRARLDKIDIVIASSGSYTAHLAGARIARESALPYVAELGDPWTYNPIWPATFMYRVMRNRRLERRAITAASLITVTTEETAEGYRHWLGKDCPPVEVVPMGFAADEFADALPLDSSKPPVLTYVGVAYRTGRNLLPVFDAVRHIQRDSALGFELVGPYSRSFADYARKHEMQAVKFHGRVPYQQSLEFIRNASILLIIGNPGVVQVPGKVFMYLAAGRPIVFVSQNEAADDPSWRILREFGGTYFCRHSPREIEAVLRSVLKTPAEAATSAMERRKNDKLGRYEWAGIGARFGQLARALVNPGRG
jgi:glycosyltransferase involved in cell wall biosynthesis